MILGFPIARVEISKEKSVVYHPEYKGVRLDIYAQDEEQTCYNVEMQAASRPHLGKRSRYYHSQMDMDLLLSGRDYEDLPPAYVIFVCDFDPFGEAKYRYTFRTQCEESAKVKFEDGRTIIFLSTHGKNESEVPEELVTLLQYMREDVNGSEREYHDSYVERLQKFIREVKSNREMEERFMVFEEMLREERAEGRTEDRKETLLLYLQNLGTVPESLCERIEKEEDFEVLKRWTELAFQSKSLEEFEEKMSL